MYNNSKNSNSLYRGKYLFDFNNPISFGMDIVTTYKGKILVLRDVYPYQGPITMQYLPFGGIQSVINYKLIIWTKSGFITADHLIYDGINMTSKEFIDNNKNLVNEVLPS